MSSLRSNILVVGAGRVGTALGLLSRRKGHRIVGVISKRSSSARALARRTGTRFFSNSLSSVPDSADVIMLAVPDTELRSVVISLAATLRKSRKKRVVFHTSGAASTDLLRPLRSAAIRTCSIHPILSFPSVALSVRERRRFEHMWFGVEASLSERGWAERFVRSLGGRPLIVPKSKKTLYHTACTFASNYTLTLLHAVSMIAGRAGIGNDLRPFEKLLYASLADGLRNGPMKALTGPVARGDSSVLKDHRAELRRALPALVPLFDDLVLLTSREALRTKRVSAAGVRRILAVLGRRPSRR